MQGRQLAVKIAAPYLIGIHQLQVTNASPGQAFDSKRSHSPGANYRYPGYSQA
jgi:hypothetical protein